MLHERIKLMSGYADGYVIPFGKFNMVYAKTENGMIGCGMFDVYALDRYQYPAARVRPGKGDSITSLMDLFEGIVKDANLAARALGIEDGMSGKEALERLCC